MSYVEQNLLPDEKILNRSHIHWIIYIPAVIFFVFAVAMMFYHLGIGIALMLVTGAVLLRAWIHVHYSEFVVTNKRIFAKIGWISRSTVELSHNKVESISFDQSVLGRIMNYGTVYLHGTGVATTPIVGIDDPLTFRKEALTAIDQPQKN